MGSGISLSDYQITEIIKREINQDYLDLVEKRRLETALNNSQWKIYKSFVEDEKYYMSLRTINDSLERIQSQRMKNLMLN
jgi:hypothetical protein